MLLQFDPAAIQRLLDLGGSVLAEKMIRLFLDNTPARMAAARDAERTGDWTTVERTGHSMKSSAAYLGLLGVQERAARLEALAAQGAAVEVRALLRELSEAYPALCTLLQLKPDSSPRR